MHDLPEELTIKIIRLLELGDIARLQQVSTHLHRVVKDNHARQRHGFSGFLHHTNIN
ncbi:F-box protein [Endozoicomonas sp. 8E]|uniref:F-box protein n=1 Tax=Endozoicomonas sp. 8E TaxID=3035692 RepID=UPI0029390FEF|nr:F-box protein [Endozoicomonas sp. 8E]WOG26057.1 F-box protein [Endozoicomonas sp. 8E]